jgi:CBS domain-containing protein
VPKPTAYKEVARLLSAHDLTSAPVVSGGGRVLGMVSEADLLLRQERSFGRALAGLPRRSRRQRGQAEALTAVELMSSPAITIHPDAPLGAAARLMNGHHIRRLPVVDSAGQLLGMVSRRDLLSVFLRPDAEIADEIGVVLASIMLADASGIAVTVSGGVATLTGELPADELIDGAVRLAAEVDGVIAVRSRLAVRPVLAQTP